MKLQQMIDKLIQLQHDIRQTHPKTNPEVIIDADEHGYYNLEKVEVVYDGGEGIIKKPTEESEMFIHLKSSNEM